MHVCILGVGRVGSAMAIDLAKDKQFDITVVDRDSNALQKLKKINAVKIVKELIMAWAKTTTKIILGR